jgi:hypothetical protein
MVMRWNKEEEGKRRCVDVGVVIVCVCGVVLVVISVASLSRSCGEGVLVARTSSMVARCAWRAEVLLLARLRVVGCCHGGGLGAGRALKGGIFK